MKRRAFIAGLGAAAAFPRGLYAQQPANMKRIGLLRAAPQPEHELAAFLRALAERDYVQGGNFVLVPREGSATSTMLLHFARERRTSANSTSDQGEDR